MSDLAIYARPQYATTQYGKVIGIGTYSPVFLAPIFAAKPVDIGAPTAAIYLQWVLPFNTSNSTLYSQMVLVRNNFSIPTSNSDGTTLLSYTSAQQIAAAPSSYLDQAAVPTQPSPIEQFNYYSIFLFDGNVWQRAGDVQALLPIPYGYGERMFSLLPQVYRDMDQQLGTPGPLENFLNLLGFQFDFIRSFIETLVNITDPWLMAGNLLPLLAESLGLDNEPFLGMRLTRAQVANIVHLYKTKGSVQGLLNLISTFVQYSAQLDIGDNLLLDGANSAFTHGKGLWLDLTHNELSQQWAISGIPPVAGFPIPTKLPSTPPNNLDPTVVSSTAAVIYFLNGNTGPMDFSSIGGSSYPGGPASTPVNGGIPIIPFDIYTFSAYVWQAGIFSGTSVQYSATALYTTAVMISPTALTATTPVNGVNNISRVNANYIRTTTATIQPTITVGSGHQFILEILWYDKFGNFLNDVSSPATGIPLATVFPPFDGWTRLSVTGISPANAQWATLAVETQDSLGTNDPVYLGWLQFEDGNVLPYNMASFEILGPFDWGYGGTPARIQVTPQMGSLYPAPDGQWIQSLTFDASSLGGPTYLQSPDPNLSANAIPVFGGYTYTFTGSFQCANFSRQLQLQVFWYSGIIGAVSFLGTSSAVSRISVNAWTNLSFNITAPAGATYVLIRWSISDFDTLTTPSPEILYADALGILVGANQQFADPPTSYANPRDIGIHFTPIRSNLIPNPSFNGDTRSLPAHWGSTRSNQYVSMAVLSNLTTNPVLVRPPVIATKLSIGPPPTTSITANTITTATTSLPQNYLATAAVILQPSINFNVQAISAGGIDFLQLTGISTGPGSAITTEVFPVYVQGVHYALSFYVQAANNPALISFSVNWYDQSGTFISTQGNTSGGFTDTVGAWTRYDSSIYDNAAPLTSPTNAAFATVSIIYNFPVVGDIHYIDAILFEPSTTALPYMDGSTPAPGQLATDIFWAGTSQRSQSFYYPNFVVRQSRLTSLLPEFTPLGSTFSFNYRQPIAGAPSVGTFG